jgi:hypothetical protein
VQRRNRVLSITSSARARRVGGNFCPELG